MRSETLRRIGMLFLFCIIFSLTGCHSGGSVGPDSYGGTLVYDYQDGNIYTYNMSNGERKQLTHAENGSKYLAPACSPDGKKIAFDFQGVSQQGSFISTLDVMDTDGSDIKVISTIHQGNGFITEGCAWSPDGSMIAFTKPSSSGDILFVVNVNGTGEHAVTSPCTGVVGWNPWNDAILFVRPDTEALATDLYTVSLDGSNLHRFLHRPLVNWVAWTSDPNLAYVGIADTATIQGTIHPWSNIYLYDLETNVALKPLTSDDRSIPFFVLPGGSRILSGVVNNSAWWAYSLYVIDTSGTQREKVTDLDYVQPSVKLSSSGNEVAFLNLPPNAGSELYVAAIDGSSQELIAKDQSGFSFDWLPK